MHRCDVTNFHQKLELNITKVSEEDFYLVNIANLTLNNLVLTDTSTPVTNLSAWKRVSTRTRYTSLIHDSKNTTSKKVLLFWLLKVLQIASLRVEANSNFLRNPSFENVA